MTNKFEQKETIRRERKSAIQTAVSNNTDQVTSVKNSKKDKSQIACFIDTEVYVQIGIMAATTKKKKADIVNEALKQYFDNINKTSL